MILVTLGTQDKPFIRLLNKLEEEVKNGNITDEVIVQAGNTKFTSKYMKVFDMIPVGEFSDLIKKCDLLITHGGVGSIITGLKNNKKVIGIARLKKYGEHTNDHQLQILENFDANGYIIHLKNLDELCQTIDKAKKFKPKKYKSNTNNMLKLIEDYIKNN